MDKLLQKAIDIATKAHEGVTRDITGEPYINHPKRVADRVNGELKIVAWLHDVLEDRKGITAQDLIKEGIP